MNSSASKLLLQDPFSTRVVLIKLLPLAISRLNVSRRKAVDVGTQGAQDYAAIMSIVILRASQLSET